MNVDEDALVLPGSWLRSLHPRRGGAEPPETRIDPEAGELLRGDTIAAGEHLQKVLADPDGDELTACARAWLSGEADPLGAAVVAVALAHYELGWGERRYLRFADAWAADHGLEFAAAAFVELAGLVVDDGRGITTSNRRWTPRSFGAPFFVKKAGHGDGLGRWWGAREGVRRLRTLLAAADDATYAAVTARLAGLRDTPERMVVVSYLIPTRQDWLDEVLALPPSGAALESLEWMVWCSLGEPAQIKPGAVLTWYDSTLDVLATIAENAGTALAPLLPPVLAEEWATVKYRKLVYGVLAVLPDDEAFRHLADRIDDKHARAELTEAMRRFPVRALRVLAPAADGTSKNAGLARELLRAHVLSERELVTRVLPDLADDVRAVVTGLLSSPDRAEDADPGDLPELLVTPPWTRKRTKTTPVVLTGLAVPDEPALVWAPGEREAWATADTSTWGFRDGTDWKRQLETFKDGRFSPGRQPGIFLRGPDELVRPLFAGWRPVSVWGADTWMKGIVAKYGLEALPHALHVARANPATFGGVLLPFLSAEVATSMADWLGRLASARSTALAWLTRHRAHVAPLLVPAALGPAGPERANAERVLRTLDHDAVREAARAHGDEAVKAVEALLAVDPLDLLPARVPKPGEWADPALLPQVLLRNGRALPDAATGHLVTVLALSKPGEVYAGVATIREACTPESLAAFSWALFQRWLVAGAPAKDGWAMFQLGLAGDDETVRRLTPLIRAWPGEGGHKRAVAGLDVLAEVGSDVALMHLNGIAQKVKFKGLRTRAQEKIEEIAATRGLTPEQLADRLVPGFGLDADGGMTLDYGPRRFTVGFDEQLRPYVTDEDGRLRKALPKPGAKDDPELAPAAYQAFAALKKDVRTVAADQVRRLEAAMVARRGWTVAEFGDFFARHPLVWHIARRLVWITEPGSGGGTGRAFRVAEDRTLADVSDETFTPDAETTVRIAHPLDLGGDLAAWSELFADYEIVQPFPQLARPVHDRSAHSLKDFEDAVVPSGRVVSLERRGWVRAEPQDAGVQPWISKKIGARLHAVIDLDPGIVIGEIDALGDQTLAVLTLTERPGGYLPAKEGLSDVRDLDPIIASELIADLLELTRSL
ncbi:DUF4132 domain-containing protein [Spirillospora sp. NPDC047279]|uniref:DUF4132 domain-containing protein n=1 Tax=Spirillospora sp. NPDC047279 TaxID=3155478 RepID=UPI0033F6CA6E